MCTSPRSVAWNAPNVARRVCRVSHATDDAGDSPAFFHDCADYLSMAGERARAIRILTDVTELRLDEP
jgi:hypothetical protein